MRSAHTRTAITLTVMFVLSCGGTFSGPVRQPHVQAAVDTFMAGQSPDDIRKVIAQALEQDPDNPILLAMDGDIAYMQGDFSTAMDRFSAAVTHATSWDDPLRDPLAELSLVTIDAMDQYTPGYEKKLDSLHEETLADLYRTTDSAYFVALRSRIQALSRAGRFDDVHALTREGGCLTRFKAIGPFGQTELLDFDDPHPPEADFPWNSSYSLFDGADPEPTFDASSFYCNVFIEPEQILKGGTFYAASDVTVHRSGQYVLRLSSAYTTDVIIDGVTVLQLDHRHELLPVVNLFSVELDEGEHMITLKIGTRDPMPDFSLMIKEAAQSSPDPTLGPAISSRRHGEGFAALAPPPGPAKLIEHPEPKDEVTAFLNTEIALLRGDPPSASKYLEPLVDAHPNSATLMPRVMTAQLNDPFVPYSLRMNRLRVLAEEMALAHPDLWPSHLLLARLEAGQGRTDEAIDILEQGIEAVGDIPGFQVTLADLYQSRGWVGEYVAALKKAASLVPDNCDSTRHELRVAHVFSDLDAMESLAMEVVACDATDTSLYEILTARDKWQEASAEQERLQGLFPDKDMHLLDDAAMALKLGDKETYVERLTDYHVLHPTSYLALAKLVDAHLASGSKGEAIDLLEKARTTLDGPTDDISMTIAFLEGWDYLYPFRRDAYTSIAAYEAEMTEETKPSTPSVEILDHVTHRIFHDGSSLTRYHSVRKVLTKEGVERNSEFIAPPGGAVIQLRTIKADGRVLTPEDIAHKMTLSYPSLEPGDYTEAEWIQATGPSIIYPGGFSLDRWYFQILDQVLHLSEMIVVAPADMQLDTNPRGMPPALEEFEEGPLKISRWTAHSMPHRKAEPDAPNLSEFLPSLQLSSETSWNRYVEWLADMLIDTAVASPLLADTVDELVGDIDEDDVQQRAKTIFRWVNDEIDEADGLDTPVAYILEEKMGNRSRLLHAMLEEAGVPSELWIARTAYADHTETPVPSFSVYTQLIVKVGDDWLLPFADTTPYGTLPFDVRGEKAVRLFPSFAESTTSDDFDDLHTQNLVIKVLEGGRSEVTLTETYRGINAAMMRMGLKKLPKSDLDKAIETAYLAAMFNGASLTSLELPDLEDDAEEMTLDIRFTLPAMPGPIPGTIALGPFLKSYLSKIWTQLPERHFPLLISESTDSIVEVVIETDGKWDIFQPPAPTTSLSTSQGATFEQSLEEEGDSFILKRRVYLPTGRVSPEDYAELLDFTTKIDETEGGVYILLKTEP